MFNRHLRWRYAKFLLPWRSVAEKLGLRDVCSGLDKFWDQLERTCVQWARKSCFFTRCTRSHTSQHLLRSTFTCTKHFSRSSARIALLDRNRSYKHETQCSCRLIRSMVAVKIGHKVRVTTSKHFRGMRCFKLVVSTKLSCNRDHDRCSSLIPTSCCPLRPLVSACIA